MPKPASKSKLNVSLLRRVARRLRSIHKEDHYDQGTTGHRTHCGTAACIAGHVLMELGARHSGWGAYRFKGEEEPIDALSYATDALKLSLKQAQRLFNCYPIYAWPKTFADRWAAEEDRTVLRRKKRFSRIAADLLSALASGKARL